jgi:hypothetical protein
MEAQQRVLERITVHLINKMFEYAHIPQTYNDIKDRKDEWSNDFSMTEAQYLSFKNYAIRYFKRELITSYYKAETEFEWFFIMYGFKISDKAKETSFEDLE